MSNGSVGSGKKGCRVSTTAVAQVRRVVMARQVAERWVESSAQTMHWLQVFGGQDLRVLGRMLRSFRDAKIKIGSVQPIKDLGLSEAFDSLTVWSHDRAALMQLNDWLEGHNYETSGIW